MSDYDDDPDYRAYRDGELESEWKRRVPFKYPTCRNSTVFFVKNSLDVSTRRSFQALPTDVQQEIGRAAMARNWHLSVHAVLISPSPNRHSSFSSDVAFKIPLAARPMKKTIQKFKGDAVRDALKERARSHCFGAPRPIDNQMSLPAQSLPEITTGY